MLPKHKGRHRVKYACEEVFPASECRFFERVGPKVWSGEPRGVISVRNGETGAVEHRIDLRSQSKGKRQFAESVWCLLCTGKRVWAGYGTGCIRIFHADTCQLLKEIKAHEAGVCAFAVQDNRVFSASADKTVGVWSNSVDTELLKQYRGHTAPVRSLCCHMDILFTGSEDETIRAWSQNGSVKSLMSNHKGAVLTLALNANRLWAAGDQSVITIWDPVTFKKVKTIEQHQGAIHSLVVVRDTVWSSSKDRTICVWDAEEYQLIRRFGPQDGLVANPTMMQAVLHREVWTVWCGLGNKHVALLKAERSLQRESDLRMKDEGIYMTMGMDMGMGVGVGGPISCSLTDAVSAPLDTFDVEDEEEFLRRQHLKHGLGDTMGGTTPRDVDKEPQKEEHVTANGTPSQFSESSIQKVLQVIHQSLFEMIPAKYKDENSKINLEVGARLSSDGPHGEVDHVYPIISLCNWVKDVQKSHETSGSGTHDNVPHPPAPRTPRSPPDVWLEASEREREMLQREIVELSHRHKEMQAELESSRDGAAVAHESLEKELQEQKALAHELRVQLEEANGSIETVGAHWKIQCEQYHKEVGEAEEKYRSLKEHMEKTTDSLNKLEKEHLALRQEADESQMELAKTRDALQKYDETMADLMAANAKNDRLSSVAATLHADAEKVRAEFHEQQTIAMSKQQELRSEIMTLKKQIQAKEGGERMSNATEEGPMQSPSSSAGAKTSRKKMRARKTKSDIEKRIKQMEALSRAEAQQMADMEINSLTVERNEMLGQLQNSRQESGDANDQVSAPLVDRFNASSSTDDQEYSDVDEVEYQDIAEANCRIHQLQAQLSQAKKGIAEASQNAERVALLQQELDELKNDQESDKEIQYRAFQDVLLDLGQSLDREEFSAHGSMDVSMQSANESVCSEESGGMWLSQSLDHVVTEAYAKSTDVDAMPRMQQRSRSAGIVMDMARQNLLDKMKMVDRLTASSKLLYSKMDDQLDRMKRAFHVTSDGVGREYLTPTSSPAKSPPPFSPSPSSPRHGTSNNPAMISPISAMTPEKQMRQSSEIHRYACPDTPRSRIDAKSVELLQQQNAHLKELLADYVERIEVEKEKANLYSSLHGKNKNIDAVLKSKAMEQENIEALEKIRELDMSMKEKQDRVEELEQQVDDLAANLKEKEEEIQLLKDERLVTMRHWTPSRRRFDDVDVGHVHEDTSNCEMPSTKFPTPVTAFGERHGREGDVMGRSTAEHTGPQSRSNSMGRPGSAAQLSRGIGEVLQEQDCLEEEIRERVTPRDSAPSSSPTSPAANNSSLDVTLFKELKELQDFQTNSTSKIKELEAERDRLKDKSIRLQRDLDMHQKELKDLKNVFNGQEVDKHAHRCGDAQDRTDLKDRIVARVRDLVGTGAHHSIPITSATTIMQTDEGYLMPKSPLTSNLELGAFTPVQSQDYALSPSTANCSPTSEHSLSVSTVQSSDLGSPTPAFAKQKAVNDILQLLEMFETFHTDVGGLKEAKRVVEVEKQALELELEECRKKLQQQSNELTRAQAVIDELRAEIAKKEKTIRSAAEKEGTLLARIHESERMSLNLSRELRSDRNSGWGSDAEDEGCAARTLDTGHLSLDAIGSPLPNNITPQRPTTGHLHSLPTVFANYAARKAKADQHVGDISTQTEGAAGSSSNQTWNLFTSPHAPMSDRGSLESNGSYTSRASSPYQWMSGFKGSRNLRLAIDEDISYIDDLIMNHYKKERVYRNVEGTANK